MAPPVRWFEDFRPGDVFEFGDYLMSEAEVLEFAGKYDPQPFHTDALAAKDSIFGGLIASGWHTCSAVMRMMVDEFVPANASMGSPGIDELRWIKPVRPGDRLRVRITIVESIPSRSKPDRGVVRSFSETLNQQDEVVMTLRSMVMYRRRRRPG